MIVDPYQSLAATAADRDAADLRRSALPGAAVTPMPSERHRRPASARVVMSASRPVSARLRRRAAAALRGAADRLEPTRTAC